MEPTSKRIFLTGYHHINGEIYRFYIIRLRWPDGRVKDFPSEEHAEAFLEGRKPNFTSYIEMSTRAIEKPKIESTEFNVVLKSCGEKRIPVIKVVRELTSLGLREAKEFVEAAPKVLRESMDKKGAEEIVKKLTDLGAEVEIEPVE
jgi:ribosomal protein L7/L12